jgi:hypothetical protein
MRIWVEVFNASGTKVSPRRIYLKNVSRRTVLDAPGSFSFSVPLTYDRAREWLTVERRVTVYREQVAAAPTEMLSGVIRSVTKRHASDGWSLDISGDELMLELSYKSCLLNRRFVQQPIATAINTLVALAGWTATVETNTSLVDARFDGANVLKAVGTICENAGVHYRQGSGRVLEIGAFGEESELILMNPANPGIKNSTIGLIESLNVVEESESIVNWVIALGAGEGEAAQTLAESTRDFVDSMTGADGRLVYYIADQDSIDLYGQHEAVWTYKDIAPISNSVAGKLNAANQLADATYNDMQKTKQPQITYSITARKVEVDVAVGDLVRLIYTGPIRRIDGSYLAGDTIDAYFYITRLTEKANDNGRTLDFEVSNVPRPRRDSASAVASVLDQATAKNYKPQPSAILFQDSYFDTTVYAVANPAVPTKAATYKLEIDDLFTSISKATLRVKSRPLYAWSAFQGSSATPSNNYNYFAIISHDRYPVDLHLFIDGVDVSSQFGGPWNAGLDTTLATDFTADITDLLNANLYSNHTIEVQCGAAASFPIYFPNTGRTDTAGSYSHGLIEFKVMILGVTQAIL